MKQGQKKLIWTKKIKIRNHRQTFERTYFFFDYVHSFSFAQRPQYFSYIFSLFVVEYFPPILRYKHYVVFTIPFRMC